MTIDEYALQVAEEELDTQFDGLAYIVKYIAEINLTKDVDLVPDSNIDECIQHLSDSFVKYMQDRTIDNYSHLLNVLRQILSELYHTNTDSKQKEVFVDFIEKCKLIV